MYLQKLVAFALQCHSLCLFYAWVGAVQRHSECSHTLPIYLPRGWFLMEAVYKMCGTICLHAALAHTVVGPSAIKVLPYKELKSTWVLKTIKSVLCSHFLSLSCCIFFKSVSYLLRLKFYTSSCLSKAVAVSVSSSGKSLVVTHFGVKCVKKKLLVEKYVFFPQPFVNAVQDVGLQSISKTI